MRLNAWFNLIDEAIVTISHTYNITYINQKTIDMFGYAVEELVGKPLDILLPDSVRGETHAAHMARFRASGESKREMIGRSTLYGVHKDGRLVPIRVSISQNQNGFMAQIRLAQSYD